MFILSAHSACSRCSRSLSRMASISSIESRFSASILKGTPAGLKYVTPGTKQTLRFLNGLAMSSSLWAYAYNTDYNKPCRAKSIALACSLAAGCVEWQTRLKHRCCLPIWPFFDDLRLRYYSCRRNTGGDTECGGGSEPLVSEFWHLSESLW